MELYRRYRPKKLADVVGQPDAVKVISKWIEKNKVPHAVLLSGPSGCGKTTIARILAKTVGCSKIDLTEIDCANLGNLETIRKLRDECTLSPMEGTARVYVIDEVHALRKEPQTAMLKIVEEPPKHVYFFFATTDPGKLLSTVRNRCSEVKLKLLTDADTAKLVKDVAKKESAKVSDPVLRKLVDVAAGSARKALVLLGTVIDLTNEDDRLDALSKADAEKHGIDIARALFNPKSTFKDVSSLLKASEDEPETVRRIILSYAKAVLLNAGKQRAFNVIQIFRDPYFDAGSGSALLVAGCYECFGLARD